MRLVSFNILHGRSTTDPLVDVDRFSRAVAALDPDVLGLQEVDRDQERSGGADLTVVAASAMGAVEHRFVAALSGTPGATWVAATGTEQPGSASYGVALLSRYPVTSWQVQRLPPLPVRAPMLAPGRRRPVLVSDEPRVAVTAMLRTPTGPLSVTATHLSFLRGWNIRQLRRLVRATGRTAGPQVLLGDLNMGDRTARLATGMRTTGTVATFPAAAPDRQLDHVLVRGLPGPFRVRAVETELSDHRALVVDC